MGAQTAETQALVQGLIAEIRNLQQKHVPIELQMWTLDDIANYIGLSSDYTKRYVITQRTFPPVRPIPTDLSGSRYADRWRASEVIAWSLSIDKSTFDPSKSTLPRSKS